MLIFLKRLFVLEDMLKRYGKMEPRFHKEH